MTTRWHPRDRLDALAAGESPERPPLSLWRHFYRDEDDLDAYVEAMVGWQRTYGWDFMKINPRASYHYEPWGVIMRPSPDRATKPERIGWPVVQPLDWLKITPRSVTHPCFDFQLRAITRIRRAIPRPFPLVMTVFNPISILGDMVPNEELLVRSLREEPDLVAAALRAVTDTFVRLVPEFRNAGADGLFFATTQWASASRLSVEELRRWALPYDREVWRASGDDAFNILHVCDRQIHLAEYREFDAALVNWDVALPGNPSMVEGHAHLGRPVLGGIHHETDLMRATPEELRQTVRRLLDENREIPYAVGPGCAIPVATPSENVAAVRAAVDTP